MHRFEYEDAYEYEYGKGGWAIAMIQARLR